MNERMIALCVALAALLPACGSSDSGNPNTGPGGGGGESNAGGGPGAGGSSSSSSGCAVKFGGDAASVTAEDCSEMGPFTSDSTVFEFDGSADGLDAPIYGFTLKYPNGITAKTYETKDMYYVSANLGVTATGKDYYLDFDSRDSSSETHGSVKTVFTSSEHGTADLVFESDDTPPSQATVHITF